VNGGGGVYIKGGMQLDSTLTVNANLFVNGGLTIYTPSVAPTAMPLASDSRLKTNIVPIKNALEKVSKLKGVYFNWIQNEKNGLQFDTDRHVGVIAQDVEKVLPEVISKIVDGKYLGVDYNGLIPLLIEAIHDLNDIFLLKFDVDKVGINDGSNDNSLLLKKNDNNELLKIVNNLEYLSILNNSNIIEKETDNFVNNAVNNDVNISTNTLFNCDLDKLFDDILENEKSIESLKKQNNDFRKDIDLLFEDMKKLKNIVDNKNI
jgi:hypothetical protein